MSRKGYIFTNKKHTNVGIMSTVMGSMTIASNLYAIISSYFLKGNVPANTGAALLVTAVLSGIGLILGGVSLVEKNKFYLFSYVGITLNVISLVLTGAVMHAAVRM